MIAWDKEFILHIDSSRSLTITPIKDGASIVLTLEDIDSVAVVEITRLEMDSVIAAFRKYERTP